MAKIYAALIHKGLKTIDDVPENLRDAVGGITGFEVDSNNGSGYANYGALTYS